MSQAHEGADPMPIEESILIKRAQNGDVDSFEALIRDYQPRLFRLILAVSGNAEDAEDALQETLLRVYNALPSFRGDASFSTWLYRITLNSTRNWIRTQTRASAERVARRLVQVGVDEPIAVQDKLIEREKCELVRCAIAKLPEHYRQVILLRYYQDMSYDDISHVLRIPVGTVRSRIAQGKQLLLRELDTLGYSPGSE